MLQQSLHLQNIIQKIISSFSPLDAINGVWQSQPAVGLEAAVTKPDFSQIGH